MASRISPSMSVPSSSLGNAFERMGNFSETGIIDMTDITDTGKIEDVIEKIRNFPGGEKKFQVLLDCLSQTLSLTGRRYRGICESVLKERIFDQITEGLITAEDIRRVLDSKTHYANDSNLSEVIRKIEYIAGNWNYRLKDDIMKNLGDNRNNGANYFATGLGFIVSGGGIIYSSSDSQTVNLGWAAMIMGNILAAAPFVDACCRSRKPKKS